jgi:hypothetical protein
VVDVLLVLDQLTENVGEVRFAIPGGVLLAIGWLGLPAWPLVLARLVFSKPPSHRS